MADLGQDFDASSVEPNAPMEVIPAGKYQAHIVNSEMRPTKNQLGKYLWLEMRVIDGPYANRALFDRLNLVNANQEAAEIAQRQLSAICHATGRMQVSDSEQLHNIPLLITVRVKPAGPDNQGTYREAQNEIRGYSRADGVQPQSRPSVSQQNNAAPVQAQAAKSPPWRRTA